MQMRMVAIRTAASQECRCRMCRQDRPDQFLRETLHPHSSSGRTMPTVKLSSRHTAPHSLRASSNRRILPSSSKHSRRTDREQLLLLPTSTNNSWHRTSKSSGRTSCSRRIPRAPQASRRPSKALPDHKRLLSSFRLLPRDLKALLSFRTTCLVVLKHRPRRRFR